MSRLLPTPILPDILQPGLRIVFCGSAAGRVSALRGQYYAGPGNRFWRTLHDVGLTPRQLAPAEFPTLPDYGIGLTDIAKHESGSDAALSRDADDPEALRLRIEGCAPGVLAFVGKRPAGVFFRHVFGLRNPGTGRQAQTLGATAIFVLPSTSGAARAAWDIGPWRALARFAKSL